MGKKEKKIESIEQLLSATGKNLNVLEEEVDIKVQREYFALAKELSESPDEYPELCKQYVENIQDLFDEAIDPEVRKKMLVILATIEEVMVYRAIEHLAAIEAPLQKWAVIALQQSRMLLQSTLLDDPGVFISTGLGGHGQLLRYFCVFFYREPGDLQPYQQKVLKNETETAINAADGTLETVEFLSEYATMLMLLPIKTDLQPLFANIIDECNQYGNFLHENMIITNVKKLTDKEIYHLLHTKTRPELD